MEMTKLLIDQGRKRILYINGFEATSSVDRFIGFKNAFEESDIETLGALEIKLNELELNNTGRIPEEVYKKVSDMGEFTAVIGLNQLLLDAGISIAKRLGMNIVTATATAGPNEKNCDISVVQPIYEVGKEAADLLVRKIKNTSLPVTQLTLKAQIQDNRKLMV